VVSPGQLSAIAMAKSMVNWHQRHGYCANCGHPHRDEGRRLEGAIARIARPSIFPAPIPS